MTLNELKSLIGQIVADTLGNDSDPGRLDVSYAPDAKFGDFATNAAMVYAKDLKRPPREVAEQLVAALTSGLSGVQDIQIAGPGFINLTLGDKAMIELAESAPKAKHMGYKDQVIVTEYSDPNPFKVLHAGHIYTSVVGAAISNLFEQAGGEVHRVNFGGDVGLHVGKTMWAILKELGGEYPDKLADVPAGGRSEWMAKCYVAGTAAYEDDEAAKAEITKLNKRVYDLFAEHDHESAFAQVYWTCRKWSYDYFDAFYERIGTPFEKYYPESETAPTGLKTVQEQLDKGVYKKSDGAVVFEGEPYGLHTRVFINSNGLPTYEAKDVGLSIRKWEDYHYDKSVIITGNDIIEYMKVVLKSIEQFEPKLAERTVHLTHGNVKLAGGVKMSSRKGNFLRAVDVLEAAAGASKTATGRDDEQVVLGAVKYSFLKQRMGADIIFDPKESVSLEGNSGPYLQYAHARARSILAKAGEAQAKAGSDLEADERTLARKIAEYPDVVARATDELMPHHICTYLYELAQVFNRFYEANRVVGDARESMRLRLVGLYADVLRDGLTILGISAPERL
ncbi:MAG TPA: arginine--tRNA ligase [Candidatus Saccharimonadia bacterium]|jgi:arginyl-tRNA synthetase|nr:arginine--tRNA ligase [Candidatus Saccharimonadia bacterium]